MLKRPNPNPYGQKNINSGYKAKEKAVPLGVRGNLEVAVDRALTVLVESVKAAMNACEPEKKVTGITANISWDKDCINRIDDVIVSYDFEQITREVIPSKVSLGGVLE